MAKVLAQVAMAYVASPAAIESGFTRRI